ncbi:malto-oligosyltrehalose trehalohydrolase [Sinorhizobium sp. BG8]|uniref:malto-oligosyltrehalose trehalohydrolase n=1 Tax=Sinorhizobium sp. BG8 TaxID=2613773 RepID=UPI00193CEDFC|nr:malto-oligosyltrehalose trehalohydrolase [Sinorhizobium sp. BG8]
MTDAAPLDDARGNLWGARFVGADVARFRLWAPAEANVTLVVNGRGRPMESRPRGWFELTVESVKSGDAYFFRLADGTAVADPASRQQQSDATGPSLLVDKSAYVWKNGHCSRSWNQAVLYEIHIGAFTPEGTFQAAIGMLPRLRDLGITVIEVMPIAQFPGGRGWGYDGVLLYAPHTSYGTPDDVKAFVDAAHGLGIAVVLDVVYNHFGPEGNALPRYAPAFFRKDEPTPWGPSIAFNEKPVRRFFIENALQWLGDFRFDGLRFDAVEHISDTGPRPFLEELAEELRRAFPLREPYLIVEDQRSRRSLLRRREDGSAPLYTAGWNDDLHHVLHVIATGEAIGYYEPFSKDRWPMLASALADGFIFSKEGSLADGGEQDLCLPSTAYVNFLQNHDQTGNRAFGERLTTIADSSLISVLTAMLLLVTQIPMLFMGEEYGETRPFHFFANYAGDLAAAIREGRKKEVENFGGIGEGKSAEDLPDPISAQTFEDSKLDWNRAASPDGRRTTDFVRRLIALRQSFIAPLLIQSSGVRAEIHPTADGTVAIDWPFSQGVLRLRANLTSREAALPPARGEIVANVDGTGTWRRDRIVGRPGIVVTLDPPEAT